jgi:hypothetical protein
MYGYQVKMSGEELSPKGEMSAGVILDTNLVSDMLCL